MRAIILLTLLHAGVTVGAFLLLFAIGMDRFDTGLDATFLERALDLLVVVLFFPLVHFSRLAPAGSFSGLWGYVPIVLNSALWASALVYALLWFRRTRG